MKIKKNDMVRVVAGDGKGMEGKVLKVYPDTDRIIVEKVNLIKRHTRRSSQTDKGGIIEKEAPIATSNVVLICPKCNKPAKTSMAKLADGRKVRRCKKCNETLSDET
jgi:large subunit ribosomal protein L24